MRSVERKKTSATEVNTCVANMNRQGSGGHTYVLSWRTKDEKLLCLKYSGKTSAENFV